MDLKSVTVEPIILYGSEIWMLPSKLERKLDRTYTNMLRFAQDLSWRDHLTKEAIYSNLIPVSSFVMANRLQFSGHSYRSSPVVFLRKP